MVEKQRFFVCFTEVTEIEGSVFRQVLSMKPFLCVHMFI